MYERMLDKQKEPSVAEMTAYCGQKGGLFVSLNQWLSETYATVQKVTFPYGNHYGWGITHRKKQKLICNVFAEEDAFTVMMRLSEKQFQSVYAQVQAYTKEYIDNQYSCGDGGWIQYRVTCSAHFEDIQKLLAVKCS